MKTNFAKTTVTSVVLALASLGAASSFAATQPSDAMGAKTRAEVRAEYLNAVKHGDVVSAAEGNAYIVPTFVSTRTRDEVRADFMRSEKNTQFVTGTEGEPVLVAPALTSTRSREDVRAEAVFAAHNPAFPIN